jgi:3-oxoacyl-[acyl-carrier-protein] synthase-3
MPTLRPDIGVEIVGTGRYLPERRITNADLVQVMDTSDEWIVQRTGIRERRKADPDAGETVAGMATAALRTALGRAGVAPHELDLCIVATVGAEMPCPSTACQVLGKLHGPDAPPIRAGAFDLTAACSGFVYGLNLAHEMLRSGFYRTAAVVGVERLSSWLAYATHHRDHAIIFGDGAGAAVLRATPDSGKGALAHTMHSDGSRWVDLYMPSHPRHFPEGEYDEAKLGLMRMNGRGVFKFAVGTFGDAIQECLDRSGLTPDDVDHFVCHQSNVRILEAARDRFGLPPEKLYINIDRYGNTSAASVPICLDELREQGRILPGQKVMFVAFGGGLTWTTSLWQV